MKYNPLNDQDIHELESIVSTDRFSTGESNLDLHSRDMSRHPPARPEVVIWPKTKTEVSEILSYADRRLIPVTGWGAGSSLEGNPIPVKHGIVLDFSQMNRTLEIRTDDFQVDVEPGVVYKELNHQLRHTGLFFPPDPGAGATVGGMIANNASGIRTVRYGSTKDYVQRLEVVFANGQIVEMGNRAAKSSSGYDLIHLLVGSEGTLGLVTGATLRLVGIPEETASAVATFQTVDSAAAAVFEIMRFGLDPAALELMTPECIELINRETGLGLDVSTTLFMEFHGASKNQLSEVVDIVAEICSQSGGGRFRPGLERERRDQLLEARYAMGEMIRRAHPNVSRIVIDVAVPISAYPQMLAFARKEANSADLPLSYAFGHAGDGNIHLLVGAEEGREKQWEAIHRINRQVVRKALDLSGTATGEHGVGIGKAKFMEAEHGLSLEWMKRIKHLMDPNGILNPGKIFPL